MNPLQLAYATAVACLLLVWLPAALWWLR